MWVQFIQEPGGADLVVYAGKHINPLLLEVELGLGVDFVSAVLTSLAHLWEVDSLATDEITDDSIGDSYCHLSAGVLILEISVEGIS